VFESHSVNTRARITC